LSANLKRSFFRATIESVLIYEATFWSLTSTLEKKLDSAYTRMLSAVLNISWKQHPSKRELYGNLPPISTTLKDRRLRFAGHCHRSKDVLVSDLILWQPKHGKRTPDRLSRTFIDQLADDIGCARDNLPVLMNDRMAWRERVNECRVHSTQ